MRVTIRGGDWPGGRYYVDIVDGDGDRVRSMPADSLEHATALRAAAARELRRRDQAAADEALTAAYAAARGKAVAG